MEKHLTNVYKEGLHLISEFSVADTTLIKDMELVTAYFNTCIDTFGLQKVGEVYHQFPESGYTAVVCLTESHISIHTWPEFNRVTFDVFLSNYQKYNNETAEKIHDGLLKLLNAKEHSVKRLMR
ncbi:MAG: S-adenosylmethionine decarboxylase [Sediminibacterium sp.]|nr:S-adenosylmethionine decarboxylase [Sediminibacterium sp.]